MFTKLLGLLLLACQIIHNESAVTEGNNLVEGDATALTRNANIPEGYTSFPDVHAAYKVYKKPSTWEQARDLCVANGAHLAIADTLQKIRYISDLTSAPWKWLIVGFYKKRNSEQWLRADNDQPAESIPWRRNADLDMDCAGISLHRDGLIDYPCGFDSEYPVCEISI